MKWLIGAVFSIVAGFFAMAAASMGDTGAKDMEEAIATVLTWEISEIIVGTLLFALVIFVFIVIVWDLLVHFNPLDIISILIMFAQAVIIGVSVAGCIVGGGQTEDVEFVLIFLGIHLVGWLVCKLLRLPVGLCQFLMLFLGFYLYGTITDGDFAILFAEDAVRDEVVWNIIDSWTEQQFIGHSIVLVVWLLSLGGALPGGFEKKGGGQQE